METPQTIFVFQGSPNAGKSYLSQQMTKTISALKPETKILSLSSDELRIPQHFKKLPGDIVTDEEYKQAGTNFDTDGGDIVDEDRNIIYPSNKWKFTMQRTIEYMKKQIKENPNSVIIIDGQFNLISNSNTMNEDCINFLLYLNELNVNSLIKVHFFFLNIRLIKQEERHLKTNKTYDVSELKKFVSLTIKESGKKIDNLEIKTELLKISQKQINAEQDIHKIIADIFLIIFKN
jgi:hypothetical protein